MAKFEETDEPVQGEGKYKRIARHRDHQRCLWVEQGVRCERAASRITVLLAEQKLGNHLAQLWGGYCGVHFPLTRGEPAGYTMRPDPAWRERLVEAVSAALREARDPMMVLADQLATGKGNREDKVEFFRLFQARLKGLGKTNEQQPKRRAP